MPSKKVGAGPAPNAAGPSPAPNAPGPSRREIEALAAEFASCQKMLAAFGDPTRQGLVLEMMQMGDCRGARVGAIAARSNLSRPTVSHHLKILREAGIVKVRREGTRNYYYFDADAGAMNELIAMLAHARDVMQAIPRREGA